MIFSVAEGIYEIKQISKILDQATLLLDAVGFLGGLWGFKNSISLSDMKNLQNHIRELMAMS